MLNDNVPRIPTSVLTGFLGSGKTTVLSHLLTHPRMHQTAVLVNEFGEVGIDDLLLRQLSQNVVLLKSGCVCCTVGDDLTTALVDLLARRAAGEIPRFDRTIIETTGLADPAPVLHTFMTNPVMSARFRLAGVITTVDAVNGTCQLDNHAESVKQAAVADRLLITKSDLAPASLRKTLFARLQRINPTAPIYEIMHGRIDPDGIMDAGLWNPRTKTIDTQRWLNDRALSERVYTPSDDPNRYGIRDERQVAGHPEYGPHDKRINTFCVVLDAPIQLQAFTDNMEMLIARHGENLLRIKGILNIDGSSTPVVVHGVQRVFHPPVNLPAWPTNDHRSKLVFITRDLTRNMIEPHIRTTTASAAPKRILDR